LQPADTASYHFKGKNTMNELTPIEYLQGNPALKHWALKHVRIEFIGSLPTAGIRLTPKGYEIALGAIWDKHTDPVVRRSILEHELMHALRGDCLARQLEPDIDPMLANIAQDACINEHLDQDAVAAFDGITLPKLQAMSEKVRERITSTLPGWRPIYDALKEQQDEGSEALKHMLQDAMDGATGDQAPGCEGDIGECQQRHVEAILDAMKGGVNASLGAIKVTTPRPVPLKAVTPKQRLLSFIDRVARQHAKGKTRVRSRTYVRPGRVEGLRGVMTLPRARVVVALDVSGSMSEFAEPTLALAQGLRRWCDVSVCVWADSAAEMKRAGEMPSVGGGTALKPMLKLASDLQPDAIIFVTDGELGDSPSVSEYPPCPSFWCLTENGHLPKGAPCAGSMKI
jgi:predicted metal-dependent peptidase